ncbi:Rhodomycin D methylesterase DauP [Pseudoalteromonas holothuriae]|uniref:Rhodomycin D methylesterase DauP n=1 Tax=Pseudoalteromonas holothuriae TaxID=2963714 RepID=A0A9W4VM21_9GAMM|nr:MULTISPECIES: alpha/beta hydrolase [unclassified Pseudoalteromonas]CAH9049420.1 Rhodomycin D methylesterase DauP [Pseudoalteromonas sp. CIP111854]CAH9055999.1 Rhodomycin D methylesterase DauP [Pseudoalteromonas sp. CIP111951]
MPSIATSHGITINYQDEGPCDAPTVILIMGLGAQMTVWPDAFYYGLVSNGFRVIRFDNRDTGLSSQLEHCGRPSLIKAWLSRRLPISSSVPYTLEDMCLDVLELMRALKVKKAHLVGASMGGMIAQLLAAKYKKKVLSLTSIMSSSSAPALSRSNVGLLFKLMRLKPAAKSQEAAIDYLVKLNQLIGSPGYPQDEQILKQQARLSVSRAHTPNGFKRQLIALTNSQSKEHLLGKIKAPTLVIHGLADPIIPLAAGQKTAQQIHKAKFKVVPGMGHDFPPELMKKLTKWVSKHIKKAEQKRLKKK